MKKRDIAEIVSEELTNQELNPVRNTKMRMEGPRLLCTLKMNSGGLSTNTGSSFRMTLYRTLRPMSRVTHIQHVTHRQGWM